jgi:hypothetical protein
MKHVRMIDAKEHTVLMVQVENEVGVLGDSRDRSASAEAAFAGPVPQELLAHLQAHSADLVPELLAILTAAGNKTSGTWTEVFGPGIATDEIFMAWHYAKYVDRVAAAGAAEYPIPSYANAWLNEKDAKPGDYPSGGPLAHLLNIWQAGAPHLALLGPDLYAADFENRCRLFTRSGNTLFIPETNRGADVVGRNLFLAVGAYSCIGFSPFAIDAQFGGEPSVQNQAFPFMKPPTQAEVYALMSQFAPTVLEHQGKGEVIGFVLDKDHKSFVTTLGGTELEISLDEIFGRHAEKGYGIVVALGPDEFIGAGLGFRVIPKISASGKSGIGLGTADEGVFHDGTWVPGRRLNGDEDDQGRAWRFSSFGLQIERCTFYRFAK